jgi:signal recognition particle receptor subunit beta
MSSLSTRPCAKNTNIFIAGLESVGKTSLLQAWKKYSLEKKLKESLHVLENKKVGALSKVEKKQQSKAEKAKFEALLKEHEEEEITTDDEEEKEDNAFIGPSPFPPSEEEAKEQQQQQQPNVKPTTTTCAELITCPKCRNSETGGDMDCIMFDVSGAGPAATRKQKWKEIYSNNIDCLIFVVDASAPEKYKEAADLFREVLEEMEKISWTDSRRHFSVVLIANKLDLVLTPPKSANEEEDKNDDDNKNAEDQKEFLRNTILKSDGPIGSVFGVKQMKERFSDAEFLGTSCLTGEGIYNVLHFISQYVLYPKNYCQQRGRYTRSLYKK